MSDYDFSDAVDPFAGAVDPFEQPVGLSLDEKPSMRRLLNKSAEDLDKADNAGLVLNVAKGAGERASDLMGGLFRTADSVSKYLEETAPMGGFVFEEGNILPSYYGADAYKAKMEQDGLREPLDIAAKHYQDASLGYVPEHTWEKVKETFSNDGALSTSSWGEVMGYAFEQGVKSVPDMVAAVVNLPAYITSRSGEIGEARATNKGKEKADITDVLEAAPFAIGSALLERIGAKGITQAGAESFGKEALKRGYLNAAKRVGKEGGKAGSKEALTEFIQEGMIEYTGERFGTNAAMSVAEAFDQGMAGAVAGGVYGGAAGTVSAIDNEQRLADKQAQQRKAESDAVELGDLDALAEEFNAANDPFLLEGPEAAPPKPAEEQVFYADTEGEIDTTGESVARARAEQAKRDEDARIAEAAFRQNNPQYAWQQVKNNVGEEQTVLVDNYSGAIHGDTSRLEVSPEQHSNEYEAKIQQMIKQRADEAAEREKALEDKSFDPDKRFEMPSKKSGSDIAPTTPSEFVSPEPIPDAPTKEQVDLAALNTNMEPTLAQAEAGNYKKGRLKLGGLNIAIENPKGSVRKGVDRDGKEWQNEIKHHYGDISGVKGADGDNMDVFIGDNPASSRVFVIDQIDPKTGEFDEHKVMTGFDSLEEAKAGYLANYDKDWKGLGEISEVDFDTFKQWTKEGDTQKPYAELKKPHINNGQATVKQIDTIVLSDGIIDANATLEKLPDVREGHTRLYRASSSDVKFEDVFDVEKLKGYSPQDRTGEFYTTDISYADYFRQTYGKNATIKYIDVETSTLAGNEVAPGEYVVDLSESEGADNQRKPVIAIEPLSERAVLIKGVPKEMREVMNSVGEVKAIWRRKEGGWMLPKKRLAKVMPILEQHFAMPGVTETVGDSTSGLPKGGESLPKEAESLPKGWEVAGAKDIPLAAERKLDGDALVGDLPFSEMTDNDESTKLKTESNNSVDSGEYDDQSNLGESDKGRARSELEGRREVSEYGDSPENTEQLGAGKSENVELVEKGGDRGDSSLRSSTEDVGRSRRKSSGGDADYGRKGAGREGTLDDGARSTERITPSPEVSSGSSIPANFHIKDPLAIVGGGQVARFEKNQAAIELSNILRDESRVATTEEQEVLAGYTGWGSFGQELFQGTWENPKPKANWEKRDSWLREHLGQKEWESAQRSITNAHYTDPPTVMTMWSMLERMGFDGGRVLEPSIGIGNFFGMMPPEIKSRSQLAGIELDHLTGGMAKQLYPDANIQVMGYQDSKTPDNFYDLVVGNWPFENTVIADRRYNRLSPMLHDYFFLKAVDQVRPGGIVMGITSKGSMDKKDISIRAALAKKAELVASFRLPSGAFEEYAGTKVVTDIVILKKRDEPIELVADAGWVESVPYMTPSGHEVFINEYYIKHPENVIGTIDYGHGTTFNRPGMIVKRPDDVKSELDRIVKLVPEGVFSKAERPDHIKYVTNHTSEREGALTKNKEGFFVVRGEYLAPAEQIKKYSVKDAAKTAEREAQLSDLVEMRKLYGELIDAERSLDKDAEPTRKELNKAYKGFVKKYGSLSNSFGLKYLKQIDDPFFPSLAALEIVQGNKTVPAKILTESTTRGPRSLVNPSVSDAYVLARSDSINPSLSVVAKLAKKPKAQVKKELIKSGAVFELPNGDIAPSDIYLSGNVRDKYRQALAAVESGKDELARNVAALKAVLPPTIPYFKIEVQMGASWVPTGVYAEYVAHMLNLESANEIEVSYKQGNWSVKFDSALNKRPEATSGFGTREYDFKKLVNAAIRNQTVTIRHKDSNGNSYVATAATKEANEKISNIREKFGEWLWSDPDRRLTLETEYNEVRNAYAEPVFDGSFLSFEGMALSLGNGPFDLRSHQANAIWRALVTRKSLNAHEVGTGKTFTMGGIAVESRRYGIAKKPLILAHNANSKSVATEIQMMYPSSKVLYIDNLSPSTIDIKLRQIANDDWDAVVVPHSLISRFAFKEETLMEMAYEEIANLEAEAREAAQEDGVNLTEDMLKDDAELNKLRSQTAKELVKMRNRIIESIKKQAQRASKENSVTFEELGVDMVLVDEAHEFKKPPFATRMRMKGLNVQSSDQSIALSFMTRYIRAHNNGANVHLFTGTPITNTLTEIFHMMRYIMQEEMSAADVDQWDGWFGSFAKEVQDVELNAAAEYESVTRLAGFINVPELRRMIGQYMDVVFADDMPEMQPRRTESGKVLSDELLTESEREFLINGRTENAKDRPYKQVIIDTADLTPEQELAFQDIQGFAKSWREMDGKTKREVMRKGGNESPIIYEGLATKASFDVRLMEGERLAGKEGVIDDHADSKASRVVSNVKSIYDSHEKATQVIFTELGINDTAERSEGAVGAKVKRRFKTFSTVKDIVARLEAEGIPSNQIAVVSGSTSKDKRKAIADAMNRAEIRVVIGSTKALGVGVNMQRNLRAMHHLDAPWMPGDLEQRNGRGHRQGNQWNTVLEYRYLTDRLDGRRWQVLAIKQRFINAFLKSNDEERVIEGDAASDEDNDILKTFSEAAGDPRILIREKLNKKLGQLQSRERLHTQGIADARRQSELLASNIEVLDSAINKIDKAGTLEKVSKLVADNAGKAFTMNIDGRSFTARKDADHAITDIVTNEMREGDGRFDIGSYGGYPLFLSWPKLESKPVLTVKVGDTPLSSRAASVSSLEHTLRNYGSEVSSMEAKKAELSKSLERMRKVSKEPFHMADQLRAVETELNELDLDIANNPVPPPAWLRSGAPTDTEVHWNGKRFVVTGHRWNNDGWFVLAKDKKGPVVIPYNEVTDKQAMAIYEPREFFAPELVSSTVATEADKVEVDTDQEAGIAFSQSKSERKGSDQAFIKRIVDKQVLRWPSAPPVIVVQSITDLPHYIQAAIRKRNAVRVNGVRDHQSGSIYLVADNLADGYQAKRVLAHEAVGHYAMEEMLGDEFKKVVDRVQQLKAKDKVIQQLAGEVKGEGSPYIESAEIIAKMAENGVKHPMLVKAYAALRNFLRRLGFSIEFSLADLKGMLVDAALWLRRPAQYAPSSGSGIYSEAAFSQDQQGFESFVDDALSGNASRGSFEIGTTPAVLQALGAEPLPVEISAGVIRKAINDKHHLSVEAMKKIPEQLADPVMVFDSDTQPDSFVVLTELKDTKGSPVVVAIHMNVSRGRTEINRIASVYGKDNPRQVGNWIDKGLLAYRHTRKSRSWLQSAPLQLRWEGVKNGSRGKIITERDLVKSQPLFSQDSSDSRLMNNIDQYGADVAESIKKVWKKQWTADLRPAWLALLTRRHLADIATGVLPQIKQYVRIAQYMDARRNDLLTEGADIADKWSRFNIKHRAEGRALADLMHDTTIAGVDPSKQYQPIITKEEVEEIRRKNTILIKERSHDGAGGGKTGIRSAAQLREEISAAETKLAQEYNRQAARSDLLKRWNQLSPEAQTIYREVRDLYKARQRQTLEALEARIGRTITDGKSAQALVSMLREEFEQVEVQEPYFPLSRFGDYWVSATKGDERVFQMFESTSEQNAFMEDMKEQGFKVRHGVKLGNLKELDGVSSKFVADIETLLDEKLGNSPKGEQLRDEIYQMYLKTMPDLSMRKHFIHRKKTAGYAADALRAYAHNIFHGSYQLARLEYVDQLQAELSDMEQALTTDSDKLADDLKAHKLAIGMQNLAESSLRDMLGDFNRALKSEGELSADDEISYRAVKLALKHRNEPKVLEKAYGQLARTRDAVKQVGKDKVKAGHIYTEMLKRHEWAMNPKGASWANWASSIGFVWYLGVSPAAAFVNLTQTPAVALPMLGARYGWGASSKALSRTTREYMAGGFGIENKLSGERLKAYQEAVSSGVIDKTLAHDLAAVSQEGATYNPVRHGVMKGVSFLFHHAERMNREVTYMAAYDLARSRGLRHEKAVQAAHDLTWDAHFDYSSGNKARVMQGDVPKVLLMFRQFSLNMTYMLVRSAQQSISKETDPATRKIAKKQLAGVLGMHFAFAGSIGLPLFSVFAGIMNAIFDDDDDPYDFEVEMRNYLADTFPKPVADTIAKGVFNAALGVDVHSRTSINDLWLRSSNRELEGRDSVAYWFEQLMGPMGGIALNAGTAYQLYQDGHSLRALESTVPKFAKDMLKGYRYWDEGVNTLRGDPLIEDLPPALAVVQAMGLSPASLNDRYDANNAVKGKERAILGRKQNLMNLYYLAYRAGDKEGMEEVVEKIRRFNRANPKVRIRKVDLIRSLRARRKASARSEHGVMVSKKLRHLKEEGRFAE